MSMEVSVHEAKTHLSRILRLVASGEEVIITRSGKPVARVVTVQSQPRRVFGTDAGMLRVPEDFDAPMAAEVLDDFAS